MTSNPKVQAGATLADFLAIPEEDRFHELLGDEIVEKAAPSGEHSVTQIYLGHELVGAFGKRPGGGKPGGWWFATEPEIRFGRNICRPDIAGWRRERVPQRPSGKIVEILPDWICEILSTEKRNDLVRKKHIYHQHNVGHYWIADPEEGYLLVYRWMPGGYYEALSAERGQRVRAEPFDAVEFPVGAFFGDDEE